MLEEDVSMTDDLVDYEDMDGNHPPTEVEKEVIFRLIRDRGPLDATQLSIDLLIPLGTVVSALKQLSDEDCIEQRSEPGAPTDLPPTLIVWGLTTKFFRRAK